PTGTDLSATGAITCCQCSLLRPSCCRWSAAESALVRGSGSSWSIQSWRTTGGRSDSASWPAEPPRSVVPGDGARLLVEAEQAASSSLLVAHALPAQATRSGESPRLPCLEHSFEQPRRRFCQDPSRDGDVIALRYPDQHRLRRSSGRVQCGKRIAPDPRDRAA